MCLACSWSSAALHLLPVQDSGRPYHGSVTKALLLQYYRVVTGNTKRGEQGTEFQEHGILPGAHDVREHAPRAMIKRMPEPPRGRFGPDETPHFIEFGCAIWSDADGGA